mgnify:CR=1 FL=1
MRVIQSYKRINEVDNEHQKMIIPQRYMKPTSRSSIILFIHEKQVIFNSQGQHKISLLMVKTQLHQYICVKNVP